VIYQQSNIQHFITTNPNILAYWNYLPYVYCVKSNLGSLALRNLLDPIFSQGSFLIAELNKGNLDGRLQQEAWPWFYDTQTGLAAASYNPFDIAPTNVFGSLTPSPPPTGGLMELGNKFLGNKKK
jgi:hypothetical protein